MDPDEMPEVVSRLEIGPSRCGDEYNPGPYSPAESTSYEYVWGMREFPAARGEVLYGVEISPAVVVGPGEDPDEPDGGLFSFLNLQSAKLYCSETLSGSLPKLVIAVRIRAAEESPLICVERADYHGYLRALTLASSLTGVPFEEIATPGPSSECEERVGIRRKIVRLRNARRRGDNVDAAILEIEIREDFRARHFRDIHHG